MEYACVLAGSVDIMLLFEFAMHVNGFVGMCMFTQSCFQMERKSVVQVYNVGGVSRLGFSILGIAPDKIPHMGSQKCSQCVSNVILQRLLITIINTQITTNLNLAEV